MRARVASTMLALLAPGMLPAQELLWERTGTLQTSQMLGPIVAIGDIDHDGYSDLLTIAFGVGSTGFREYQLWFLSGKDGQVLRVRPHVLVPGANYNYRTIAATGDMDGDGVGDYAVTQWDQGCCAFKTIVEVRSGSDDRLIWSVTNTWASLFGFSLLGNLDVDGDGKPDLLVTAPRDNQYGAVYVFRNDGALIRKDSGTPLLALGYNQGFSTLGRVGDVDRDGCDDYVVGAAVPSVTGGAAVISGKTGAVLIMGYDEQAGDGLGNETAGCGDIDGDGIPDFVAGNTALFQRLGVITAFSGKDGHVIYSWRLPDPMFETTMLQGGIDVDRDGVPDIIAGCPYVGLDGTLFVFSGRDGSILARLERSNAGSGNGLFGVWFGVIGPQPGSPYPCFAVAEPGFQLTLGGQFGALGRISVYRGSPAGTETYGLSCKGRGQAQPLIGVRDLQGKAARITVHDAPPASPAVLLVGRSRQTFYNLLLPYPLDLLGLPGCSLFTSADVMVPVTTGSMGVARGYAALDVPAMLSATGPASAYAQWFCLSPSAARVDATSDALALYFR